MDTNDALTCKICLKRFTLTDRRPRNFICGDTFCTPCCAELICQSPVKCPICKEESKIKFENVNKLPVNEQVEKNLHVSNPQENTHNEKVETNLPGSDPPENTQEKKKCEQLTTINKGIKCQICCNSYTTSGTRRPRVFSCGHSLCGECASKLLINGEIVCPVCKKNYKYRDIDEIGINRELENIIEEPTPILLQSNPVVILKNESTITPTVPLLHNGICKDHGTYKVHYCLTHAIFVCSDCVVAYHLGGNCSRVPVGELLKDRKAETCKTVDTETYSLQEIGREIEVHSNTIKEVELNFNTKLEKLQSEIQALEQEINVCQTSVSKTNELMNEGADRQMQAQSSRNNVMSLNSFTRLLAETQKVESSELQTQEWIVQVKDRLKQVTTDMKLNHDTCNQIINLNCLPKNTYMCEIIACPRGCGHRYLKCKQDEHDLLCGYVEVPCINTSHGCTWRFQRKYMGDHIPKCSSMLRYHLPEENENLSIKIGVSNLVWKLIQDRPVAGSKCSKCLHKVPKPETDSQTTPDKLTVDVDKNSQQTPAESSDLPRSSESTQPVASSGCKQS